MIQKILNNGRYEFRGNLDDLKKCLGSLRVTKIIKMGRVCGIEMCDLEAKFKYHGTTYKLFISKVWSEDKLIIELMGIYGDVQSRDKR